ncbi:MAG TPA: putative dsRNA-binding protein, partial [Lacipirellula sp.]
TAAWGKSKKESEQRAAHNAINELRGEPAPYPCEDAAAQDEADEVEFE